eukprot:7272895-Pyramimonas_sp.AAC.1
MKSANAPRRGSLVLESRQLRSTLRFAQSRSKLTNVSIKSRKRLRKTPSVTLVVPSEAER